MAKSARSKWKKKHNKAKAVACAPELHNRLERLNDKLDLVSKNAISKVPMQDPCPHFHFSHPTNEPGKALILSTVSTNVRKGLRGFEGNANGTAGIQSAKKTEAKYFTLAAGQQQQSGDEVLGSSSAAAAASNDEEEEEEETLQTKKRTILPKAADLKKQGAKKMKEGPHGRLTDKKKPKQGYDRPKK